jgi:hypothetical protein
MGSKYKAIKVKGKKYDEHRFLMEKYIGRKLTYNEVVHHKDENKSNNLIDNLEIISREEHSRLHMKGKKISEETIKKLRIGGIKSRSRAKLSEKDVFTIRELIKKGESNKNIAIKYSVDVKTIWNIKTRKTYFWLK